LNFSTNKTDLHDITEILLKVALKTISLTLYTRKWKVICFIIWCWFHTQFIYFAQFSMFLYVIEMFTTLLGHSQYRHWHWHHCILQFLKYVVIIIKAKADLIWCWLFCVCRLVFLLLKLLNYLAFQSLDFERTWWRLIQKCSVCTKLDTFYYYYFVFTNHDLVRIQDIETHFPICFWNNLQ
jgi:hypothetical protein